MHNALGLFSLPFHLVMALTAVVFAFHDQFYDAQDAIQRIGTVQVEGKEARSPPLRGEVLPPAELPAALASNCLDSDFKAPSMRTMPRKDRTG